MIWWVVGFLYVLGLGLILVFFKGAAILNKKLEIIENDCLAGKPRFAEPVPQFTFFKGTIVWLN